MKLYFAPLEGIATWSFRQVHHRCFPGIDRYYTPFLAATQTETFKRREIRDILPENNEGLFVVPQILGNDAGLCASAVRRIAAFGYREVDFNLGCSMPQVANRGRGAGFLKDPDALDRFFEELFAELDKGAGCAGVEEEGGQTGKICLSVKTRIGVDDPGEARQLLRIFNRYPISELIVHPRLKTDRYTGRPNLEVFRMFYEECAHPLCYNGDIFTPEDYRNILELFPKLSAVMIGRGLVEDPSLARQIAGGGAAGAKELEAYLHKVREGYLQYMPSDREVLPHMKEIWFYMAWHFCLTGKAPGTAVSGDQVAPEVYRMLKKLRKARDWDTFAAAQRELLACW
jgi:tRNA-dihydrouridine synthase